MPSSMWALINERGCLPRPALRCAASLARPGLVWGGRAQAGQAMLAAAQL
jgi:hypothetical protein